MRPYHLAAAALLLLPALLWPVAGASPPTIQVSVPVASEFIFPGKPERVNGEATIGFPGDANCPAGMSYGFAVGNHTAGVTVRLLTPNGTLPASQVKPGESATLPFNAEVDVGREVVAYSTITVRVKVMTGACGNLQANETTGQGGARAGFLPKVNLTLVEETSSAWRLRAENLGNARARLEWVARQPALGRVLAGGTVTVNGPESEGIRSTDFTLSRTRHNESAEVRVDVTIVYDGDYPYRPDERPPNGNATLVVYEPPKSGMSANVLPYVLLTGAFVLIAVGIAGGWWMRRRGKR